MPPRPCVASTTARARRFSACIRIVSAGSPKRTQVSAAIPFTWRCSAMCCRCTVSPCTTSERSRSFCRSGAPLATASNSMPVPQARATAVAYGSALSAFSEPSSGTRIIWRFITYLRRRRVTLLDLTVRLTVVHVCPERPHVVSAVTPHSRQPDLRFVTGETPRHPSAALVFAAFLDRGSILTRLGLHPPYQQE